MNSIKVIVREKIALLSLDRGKSNAIDTEMVIELKDMLQNIEKDENITGVILTGKDDYFSAGLDLINLYEYSKEQMKNFWGAYLSLIATAVIFKKPLIAAINGHTPAAGTVLALCCDYRVMADGDFNIGLNDVALGIIVPDSFFQLYAAAIGTQKAKQFILEAKLMQAKEALDCALINEMVKKEDVVNAAVRQMQKYLQFNKNVWQETKLSIRENLIKSVQLQHTDAIVKILEEWWSPYNRSILQTIIQNLKKA